MKGLACIRVNIMINAEVSVNHTDNLRSVLEERFVQLGRTVQQGLQARRARGAQGDRSKVLSTSLKPYGSAGNSQAAFDWRRGTAVGVRADGAQCY